MYFYGNRTFFSRMVREIIEYVIRIIEEKYDLSIYYEYRVDEYSEHPYMVVNDLAPIIFDELPDIDVLIKILVMASNTPVIYNNNVNDLIYPAFVGFKI